MDTPRKNGHTQTILNLGKKLVAQHERVEDELERRIDKLKAQIHDLNGEKADMMVQHEAELSRMIN
jgi:cell division protein FtsB